jgi:hypothetical protein
MSSDGNDHSLVPTGLINLKRKFDWQEAEIARLRAALEEITKCDDDGYGPAGYCANIAQKALAN